MSLPQATSQLPYPAMTRSGGWQRHLAVALFVLVILFSTHALHLLFTTGEVHEQSGRAITRDNPAYQALFAMMVMMVAALVPAALAARRDLIAALGAFGFCGFIAFSALWSVNPSLTVTNGISFTFQVGAAWVISQWIEPQRFLSLLFSIFSAILAMSFLMLAIDPSLVGTDRYGGGWLTDQEFAGIMASKNAAGYVFAALYIMALNGSVIGVGRPLRSAVAAGALIAAVLSNSATAVAILVLGTAATFGLALVGRLRWAFTYLGIAGVLAAVVTIPFVQFGDQFGVLGRDASFTGRADLWAVAMEKIGERPFLGFGYNGFFDTDVYSPAWSLWSRFLYYFADNFHNSAIEMTISLGLVGLAAFIAIALRAGWVVFSPRATGDVAIVLGLVLAAFYVGSAMDFTVMHHNYVATFVTFYCFFSAGRNGH